MSMYIWRIVLGIALGWYGTWVIALVVTVLVLTFRIPQVTQLVRMKELGPAFGLYFASKAASFLIPLWLTVLILDGGPLLTTLVSSLGLDLPNMFFRKH